VVDVFISYPRVERARVEPIKAKLETLRLETFFDVQGIDGGDTFPDVIDRALKSAKAVLGVWSPRAFQSKWCMIECRVGATRGVLVPVALERFSALDMKSDFMTTNYLDLTDFDGRENHEGWQLTLRLLSRHVGRELVGPAAVAPQRQTPTPPAPPPSRPVPKPAASPKKVPLPDSAFPEMVRIPPGRFLMGSPPNERGRGRDEGPQHEVRINYAFELGKYPVTFAEWDAALMAGAELETPNDQGWGRDRRPLINVSWDDAQAYIAFLNEKRGISGCSHGYRLPSEAEWEYSCRAGTTTAYWTGVSIDKTQVRNISSTPVGSFSANGFGLHDMLSNRWEWCADAWNDNYSGAPNNGSAGLKYYGSRVLRGGSLHPRSAYRGMYDRSCRHGGYGFRVARTL
jgi:formylglycine-generating enzyme required for sulfatase activity